MSYRLTGGAEVIRIADGAVIPADPQNRDRQRYEAWLAEGNAPQAAPAPPEPEPRAIAKTTIYRRATDEELELVEQVLPTLSLRLRLLWQDARNNEVLVEDVLPLLVAVVGEERAAALLA